MGKPTPPQPPKHPIEPWLKRDHPRDDKANGGKK